MKRLFLNFILITITFIVNAQQITTKVDERVELMCVVFRLAEAREYVNDNIPKYTGIVDVHFLPHKNHELIEYTQRLRGVYGIGYNAPMSLAAHLQIENGKVKLNSNFNKNQIEYRWHQDSLPKYIDLLNDFYQKTEFDKFFQSNADFYAKSEQNFKTHITDNVNFTWFENFFGTKTPEQFILVLGLLNGGNNYGANTESLDGLEEIYSIIGCRSDSLGMPQYSPGATSIVAHEFNHSFCNPLIHKFYLELYPHAQTFFSLVETEMRQQRYGTVRTYLSETLVRASELKYRVEHSDNPSKIEKRGLCSEISSGFLWVDTLYHLLSFYEKNRDKYPTLEIFMPEIVKLQNNLDPNEIYHRIENSKAEILGTNVKFNDLNVDYNLDSITVFFDRPMYKDAYGYNSEGLDANGNRCHNCVKPIYKPDRKQPVWSEDGKQLTFFMNFEPDTEYSLNFPNHFFKSPDGCISPKNTYYVYFKTRKKE